ncbi:hypothetical protein ACU4GD_12300 [Cupriavidus basilensis]
MARQRRLEWIDSHALQPFSVIEGCRMVMVIDIGMSPLASICALLPSWGNRGASQMVNSGTPSGAALAGHSRRFVPCLHRQEASITAMRNNTAPRSSEGARRPHSPVKARSCLVPSAG